MIWNHPKDGVQLASLIRENSPSIVDPFDPHLRKLRHKKSTQKITSDEFEDLMIVLRKSAMTDLKNSWKREEQVLSNETRLKKIIEESGIKRIPRLSLVQVIFRSYFSKWRSPESEAITNFNRFVSTSLKRFTTLEKRRRFEVFISPKAQAFAQEAKLEAEKEVRRTPEYRFIQSKILPYANWLDLRVRRELNKGKSDPIRDFELSLLPAKLHDSFIQWRNLRIMSEELINLMFIDALERRLLGFVEFLKETNVPTTKKRFSILRRRK